MITLGPREQQLLDQLVSLLALTDAIDQGHEEQLDQMHAVDREAYLRPREDHYREEILIAVQDAHAAELEARRDCPFDWLGSMAPLGWLNRVAR